MWRSVLAMVLLPSLTAAQNPNTEVAPVTSAAPRQADPTNDHPRAAGPTYEKYAFYNAIPRGRSEDALIRLSPQRWVTSPTSPVSGIVPVRLDLQSADGLTVSHFHYPKTQRKKFKFQTKPVPVSSWPQISFKIRADETAALGSHTLQGRLSFQVIDYNGSGVGDVQQIDVQIPITVVEHDTKVHKENWPVSQLSPGWIVLMIVLLPVEIPVVILYYAICGLARGRCPD